MFHVNIITETPHRAKVDLAEGWERSEEFGVFVNLKLGIGSSKPVHRLDAATAERLRDTNCWRASQQLNFMFDFFE